MKQGVAAEKKHFQHWVSFPAIAYNAETGLLLGGLLVYFIEPESPEDRTSSIDLLATGTTNQQYSITVMPNFYLKNNTYHVDAFAETKYWPANYYGIGNDSPNVAERYEAKDAETKLTIERKVFGSVYVGGWHHFKKESYAYDPGTVFETRNVIGADGGTLSGLGVVLTYDSRDNVNDARSGTFFKYTGTQYSGLIGSTFDFTSHEIKLYQYMPMNGRAGIAYGGYLRATRGEIPFGSLSTPDGIRILRGIERGRFRDRDLLAFQAAYRFPLSGKWGGVVFADLARVSNDWLDVELQGWKPSYGAGLRWALNSAERLNLRLDVSYVQEDVGVVLEVRDAF